MDPTIVASLIGAAATILASLITWYVSAVIPFFDPSQNQRNIQGKWIGQTLQKNENGVENDVSLELNIEYKFRRIKGKSRVSGNGVVVDVAFDGHFVSDDYIQLSYTATESNIRNFGSMLLRLNANSDTLSGKMIGYGNIAESFLSGEVSLNKVN